MPEIKPEANIETDETLLRATTDKIVAGMLSANVAQKIYDTDERVGKEYWILATPDAFEKRFVTVAALGYPELAGVWSYTLLRRSEIAETSMTPYFRRFCEQDWGLIAINPNCLAPDIEGSSFLYQLDGVASRISPKSACGLIGFSMGGGIVLDFLDRYPDFLERTVGLVLIDPTLPGRLRLTRTRALLESNTLLIASEGERNSPGKIASALLGIPAVCFPGIHGQMPTKALDRIMEFYRARTTSEE